MCGHWRLTAGLEAGGIGEGWGCAQQGGVQGTPTLLGGAGLQAWPPWALVLFSVYGDSQACFGSVP